MELRDSDPREIGGYAVEERLGSGGMGVVYRARSASGRPLAVKVVHAHYADDEEFRVRFRRELAAARRVSGAFTAPVVDADPDADRPWMATLFIPGENLGTHVRRHGPLPLGRLRELATGLAEALRELHRTDVVHRDLKPANVMLAEDGPRVIDFGISRAAAFHDGQPLTDTGRVMGTPPYMSPEQLTDPREVGPPADVFSLGSVLVYAATGRGPFDGDSPYETAIRVVEGAPQLDGVPDELRPVVERCLHKSPKDRPTPDELLALLHGAPLPPRTPSAASAPPPARHLRPAGVIGVIGLVLAVVASFFLVRTLLDDDAKPQAGQTADLPSGYRAWQSRTGGGTDVPGTFASCAADGKDWLICAGNDVAAVRFALSDGEVGWQRSVDPTPDDMSGDDGAVIGIGGGHVLVHTNADEADADGETSTSHYRILSLETATGKVRWERPAGHGEMPPTPDPVYGGVALLPTGVVTFTGENGSSYALLDRASGRIRWTAPVPAGEGCTLHAAGDSAYLMCATETPERTRLGRLDPETGRPVWIPLGTGYFTWLGEHRGRILLADQPQDTYARLHTIDPSKLLPAPAARPAHAAEPAAWPATAEPPAQPATAEPPAQPVAAEPPAQPAAAEPAVRAVPIDPPQPADALPQLTGQGLYFSLPNGTINAFAPDTGRRLWQGDTRLDLPGPVETSATHVYAASPGGRVSALNLADGSFTWSRSAPADAGAPTAATGPRPVRLGDALYIPYGTRAVFSIDVNDPRTGLRTAPPPGATPAKSAPPKTPD
ncbi:protein kinase domain-containing protein [Streptomyces mesophilus]|uniref:protein kinase domain-containing protein n=1 Tax=Streptomyces mesophilus TaxID=1775132 RepID=UPI00331CC61A